MPKRDDPQSLELGALERLRQTPDFQVFLKLVQGHLDAVKTAIVGRPLVSPEDVALHNVNIGRLQAFQTTLRLVEARERRAEVTDSLQAKKSG